jgi:hypothetical protein
LTIDYWGVIIEFFVLCFAALLIGITKAGFGGGTGVVIGPILALMFPAKETVGLMLPMLFLCDIASLFPYWRKWDNRNVAVLMPGAVIGIVIGSFALGIVDDQTLARTIGGMAMIFALLQIYRDWKLRTAKPFMPQVWHGTLAGLGTGFVSTLSHVGGVLTTMYLIPQRMDNVRFVGTTTAVYFLVNLCKIPAYVKLNMVNLNVLQRDLPLFPLVLVGTWLGVYLNRRVPSAWFSKVVLAIVLVTGVKLLMG